MTLLESSDAKAMPLGTEPRTIAAGDVIEEMRDVDEKDEESSSSVASDSNAGNQEDPESPQDPSSGSSSSEDDDENDNIPANDDKYGSQNHSCELSSIVISSVDKLPPLPQPRDDILQHEKPRGIWTVATGIVVCVFLTHYIALTLVLPSEDLSHHDDAFVENPYQHAKLVFLGLIYAEALAALLCTAGIICADPCVVKRSQETCNPVPQKVESWILSGGPRPLGLEHYLRGSDQRIYCTKCLVWRKPGVTHFHCAICQRCCAYHDHHCNVFGKCIACNLRFWKGNAGNRLYFYGLLVSGAYGFITVCAAFLYALSIRYRPAYALPIGVAVMLLISCCCFGNGPISIVLWPFFRCLRMTKKLFVRKR